ncbi:hypothetical protein GUJ93_ZPchr0006g45436 [Zizania palustris]|uniref:Uncharacterized protein n=1 Tax=Zizania palustris TaxID=103762 RepID=A0A8J5VQS3_ZIZPA|nr:hypothetical protein GUJ93_ZPchr0006g45436 [Zizania palustris]
MQAQRRCVVCAQVVTTQCNNAARRRCSVDLGRLRASGAPAAVARPLPTPPSTSPCCGPSVLLVLSIADEAHGHGDPDSPDPLLTVEVDSMNPSQDDGTAATPINVEAEGGGEER